MVDPARQALATADDRHADEKAWIADRPATVNTAAVSRIAGSEWRAYGYGWSDTLSANGQRRYVALTSRWNRQPSEFLDQKITEAVDALKAKGYDVLVRPTRILVAKPRPTMEQN